MIQLLRRLKVQCHLQLDDHLRKSSILNEGVVAGQKIAKFSVLTLTGIGM
jgi:hypothetical protein